MATQFSDYIHGVEARAEAEGPQAVAELEAFRTHFGMAQQLKALRQEHHLTQQQLAEASGIPQSEISRIEGGKVVPTLPTLAALGHPLGVRPGWVGEQSA